LSIKISTLLDKVNSLPNKENASIITDFYNYMQEKGSSDNHKINNLKMVIDYTKFLGGINLYDINKRSQITFFLNTKINFFKKIISQEKLMRLFKPMMK